MNTPKSLPPMVDHESADAGSMLMALLVTLVAITLSAALVPIVISQLVSTRTIFGRTLALNAAEAGIDVALGQLRSATGAIPTGNPPLLPGSLEALPPCAMTGTVSADNSRYLVTITYYGLADPATPLSCPPVEVPVTARLSSTGGGTLVASLSPGTSGTRTIDATYTFKTSTDNIAGGPIQLASPTVNPLCMDAGASASPAPGARLKMQVCKTGGSSDQRFAYTADLAIKLIGSENSTALNGMCLEAPRPHATGGLMTFQPCLGRVAYQQWSLDDNSQFRGTTDGIGLDAFCLSLNVPGGIGSDVLLGACNGAANQVVFRPQPGVGAGMASVLTRQLVNYKQFSRCLDVTNQNATSSYMIVWFCKQAPDGGIAWNQQWATAIPLTTVVPNPPLDPIRTTGTGNPGYCLRTPGSTLANQYVTMTACSATGTPTDENLLWAVYGDTGSYATSYTIVDKFKNCLTPTDLTVTFPDTHSDGTAKAKVAVCDGSELQKWNAPATLNKPLVLTNTRER